MEKNIYDRQSPNVGIGNSNTLCQKKNTKHCNSSKQMTSFNIFQSMSPFLKVLNHFYDNRSICTKPGLVRTLKDYYRNSESASEYRYTVFETMATTFVLTAGSEDTEYVAFEKRFMELHQQNYSREHVPAQHCTENLWLIKPANMNQGKGIQIFKTWREINNFLLIQPANTYWVAQKYIEQPLLYRNRQFDLRVWVLVTNKCDIFIYQNCYMRTSGHLYDMNSTDPNIHLTNQCLQVKNSNYGIYEAGNTLPYETLFQYIKETNPDLDITKIKKDVDQRMRDIVIDTILSAQKSMVVVNQLFNTFELFGYDFLVDQDLRLWLIEVNTNPFLGTPNDYIKDLLPQMIDDMFRIAIDPFFPPLNQIDESRENDFELIYAQNGSSHNKGVAQNIRSLFNITLYPWQQREQQPNNKNMFGSNFEVVTSSIVDQKYQNLGSVSPIKRVKVVSLQSDTNEPGPFSFSKGLNSPIMTFESKKNLTLSNSRSFSPSRKQSVINQKEIMNSTTSMNTGTLSNNKPNAFIIKESSSSKTIQNASLYIAQRSSQPFESQGENEKNNLQNNNILPQQQESEGDEEEQQEFKNNKDTIQQGLQDIPDGSTPLPVKLKNPIIQIDDYEYLTKLLKSQLFQDHQAFRAPLNQIISKFDNWELLGDREIQGAIKSFKFLINSKILSILVENKYLDTLIKILDSPDYPLDIQDVALEAISEIAQNVSNQKRILSSEIIDSLIKIAMSTLDEKEKEKYDLNIRKKAVICLTRFGGLYDRQMYIPGETRENDKIRKFFIDNGGLIAMIFIHKFCSQKEVVQNLQQFFSNLEIRDFQYQVQICKEWISNHRSGGQVANSTMDPQINQKSGALSNHIQQNQTLNTINSNQSLASQTIPVTNSNFLNQLNIILVKHFFPSNFSRDSDIGTNNLSSTPNFLQRKPGDQVYSNSIFSKFKIFQRDLALELAEQILNEKQEEILQRQRDEREKRELEMKEQQKQEQERLRSINERKRFLQQQKLRREEQQRKKERQQKKKQEFDRERYLVEQELQKKQLEELIRKREQLRQKQKMEEQKRKVEDDIIQQQQQEYFRLKQEMAQKAIDAWEQKKEEQAQRKSNQLLQVRKGDHQKVFSSDTRNQPDSMATLSSVPYYNPNNYQPSPIVGSSSMNNSQNKNENKNLIQSIKPQFGNQILSPQGEGDPIPKDIVLIRDSQMYFTRENFETPQITGNNHLMLEQTSPRTITTFSYNNSTMNKSSNNNSINQYNYELKDQMTYTKNTLLVPIKQNVFVEKNCENPFNIQEAKDQTNQFENIHEANEDSLENAYKRKQIQSKLKKKNQMILVLKQENQKLENIITGKTRVDTDTSFVVSKKTEQNSSLDQSKIQMLQNIQLNTITTIAKDQNHNLKQIAPLGKQKDILLQSPYSPLNIGNIQFLTRSSRFMPEQN